MMGGGRQRERYRAVSWWLTWADMEWPDVATRDRMLRRADACAEAGVNCAVLFGAHFRWDFLPLWERLHHLIAFIHDELRQRGIVLFDHHSAVLTHRPRSREEAWEIWRRNRHHVPFYPSAEAAALWQVAGSAMPTWRMIDVRTGQPAFIRRYVAEQFCMNNPDFQRAYSEYLRRLVRETRIDGLMSDDGTFYGRWTVCGCVHCRERFKREYGRRLPPVTDGRFWCNLESEAFKDWIAMRYAIASDFMGRVRDVVPAGIPLLTCCSSSDDAYLAECGMTYEEFARHCNIVMLEMCGSTPSLKGTWDENIASQLLHAGIARDHHRPSLGLGYGYFGDTAFAVWALNKFLGADAWFSTLKGRLGLPADQMAELPDDAGLVGEGYRWERKHRRLFEGEADASTGVLFSRSSRDFHGRRPEDYSSDYAETCMRLLSGGVAYEVDTETSDLAGRRCMVLSSASCLSADMRKKLNAFLRNGGMVIATGPVGFRDERGNPYRIPWLEQHGIVAKVDEPTWPRGFVPDRWAHAELMGRAPVKIAQCSLVRAVDATRRESWVEVNVGRGRLIWCAERITHSGVARELVREVTRGVPPGACQLRVPEGWYVRWYRDGGRRLAMVVPAHITPILHPNLKNQASGERIIHRLCYRSLKGSLVVKTSRPFKSVTLHSPDLAGQRRGKARGKQTPDAKVWSVPLDGVKRFFVVECVS